jgi:hypothetical protein
MLTNDLQIQRRLLADEYGIHLSSEHKYADKATIAMDTAKYAADAQSALVTTANAGVPWSVTNYIFPETIETLVAPMKSTEIADEVKTGDWTTFTMQFPTSEFTGRVSSYGDFNNNGVASANYNWIPRQSFHVQLITNYGEREAAIFGAASIQYGADLNKASILELAKFSNKMNFFGIAGIQNFGLLNDPSLTAPGAPNPKAAGGVLWANATANEVYEDFIALYRRLVTQLQGYDIDMDSEITFALSPGLATHLLDNTQFGATVIDMLNKAFKNGKIVTAPQYATGAGELIQCFADNIDGRPTVRIHFTEKLRTGPVIPGLSSFMQKKAAGGWGAVWYRPLAVAQGIGY